LGGVRTAATRLAVAWPVLGSAVVLIGICLGLIAHDHSATALIEFGRRNAIHTDPPAGSVIVRGWGYDGQIYWLQATDPLLLHASTVRGLIGTSHAYRMQRPAYPMLAWLVAAGDLALLPWSMLAINLMAALGLTAAFAVYAQRRGWNPAWAFAVGLAPGIVLSTTRDLSDVLAATAMLGGLMAWSRGRSRLSAALLTLAALSREPMALAAVAVGLDLICRCWRVRTSRSAVRSTLRGRWLPVIAPIAAYGGWLLYVSAVAGGASGSVVTADNPTFPPFRPFYAAIKLVIDAGSPGPIVFALLYLGLVLAAIVASLFMLWRHRSAPVFMAVLYGWLVLPVSFLSDEMSLTRYTVPLFLVLLLAGLEHRSRPALAICAAATAMTALLPVLI
jgi:hypothetical protein